MTEVHNRLQLLRNTMKAKGIDCYLFSNADEYGNEYISDYAKRLTFLTGFLGSAGMCAITQAKAAIFVDGRYTLQAKQQIDSKHFQILSYDTKTIKQWLNQNMEINDTLGICAKTTSLHEWKTLQQYIKPRTIAPYSQHLVDEIWEDQPQIPTNKILYVGSEYFGMTATEKIIKVIDVMKQQELEQFFISSCASVAWLLNIRGNDVPNNPLALCSALLDQEGGLIVFTDSVDTSDLKNLYSKLIIKNNNTDNAMEEYFASKNNTNKRIGITQNISIYHYQLLKRFGYEAKQITDLCQGLQLIKTKQEILNTKSAHLKNGLAITKLIHYLDTNVPTQNIDETHIADKIIEFLKLTDTDQKYIGDSFQAIVAVNENSALPHYRSDASTNKQVKENDYLLIDCGAHYLNGTTDMTRTLSFKSPSPQFKRDFTLVLKAHITLATCKFLDNTKGCQLDFMARSVLLRNSMNYVHGTGHGVGVFLPVHEKGLSISPQSLDEIHPNMLFSVEPGFYLEGSYGIRIENLYIVKKDPKDNLLFLEYITFIPLDVKNIDYSLLTEHEKQWIKNYNQSVYEKLSSYLNKNEIKWLSRYSGLD